MDTIEIPISIILEAMLAKLGLPCPKYKHRSIGRGFFETEVLFYPSERYLQASLPAHSILGYSASTLEAATNEAVREAIRYMQTAEKKVVKDYSYVELEEQRNMKAQLQRQFTRKDQKLAKRTNQLADAIVLSDVLIDKVSTSTRSIQNMVSKSLTPPCATVHTNRNSTLLDIQTVATDLTHHTQEAINMLHATGAYPLDEDWRGEESACDDSNSDEANYWKCCLLTIGHCCHCSSESKLMEPLKISTVSILNPTDEDLQAKDNELIVKGLPQLSIPFVTITISSKHVLKKAAKKLGVPIYGYSYASLDGEEVTASVTMDVPPHGDEPILKKRDFYGNWSKFSSEAKESACLAALTYLKDAGLIVVHDINFADAEKYKHKFEIEHFWSSEFYNRALLLKEELPANTATATLAGVSSVERTRSTPPGLGAATSARTFKKKEGGQKLHSCARRTLFLKD